MKEGKEKTVQVAVRVPASLRDTFNSMLDKNGVKQQWMLETLIKKYIELQNALEIERMSKEGQTENKKIVVESAHSSDEIKNEILHILSK